MCEQAVCEQVVCEEAGGGQQEEEEEQTAAGGSAQPKTRTPHKDVGKNKATAWLATPGKTHLFFSGSEDESWYLQHFCLWCQNFYLKFAWQARDGTPFFLF